MIVSLFIIKRFIPLFTSFLVFVFLLSATFLFPSWIFFLFLSLAIFSSLLLNLFLIKENLKNFWFFLIILFLLETSAVLFLIFIQQPIFKTIFILFLTFFVWLFLEAIFRFLYRPRVYIPYSLENISLTLTLLIIFWFYSSFFALKTFFNLSLPILLSLVFLINLLIIYFIFRQTKVSLEKKILIYYSFFPNLIVLELFYAFLFLPTTFYINGLVLTILFFLMINFLKENLSTLLTERTIKKYLALASFLLILTLILAKWR
ncbi:MAG: hypothetical protein N2259_01745 [Patescibacteria group bacterium]|nr:hypothetical protein [Patescibacteria group bacterium]